MPIGFPNFCCFTNNNINNNDEEAARRIESDGAPQPPITNEPGDTSTAQTQTPSLGSDGTLPPGIHRSSLEEINAVYGINDRREQLMRDRSPASPSHRSSSPSAAESDAVPSTSKDVVPADEGFSQQKLLEATAEIQKLKKLIEKQGSVNAIRDRGEFNGFQLNRLAHEAATCDSAVKLKQLLNIEGGYILFVPGSLHSCLLSETLSIIVANNHVEKAKILLDHPYGRTAYIRSVGKRISSLETYDARGYTPLMLAAQKGHKEMAELLVQRGADITAQKGPTTVGEEVDFGLTASQIAENNGHSEISNYLKDEAPGAMEKYKEEYIQNIVSEAGEPAEKLAGLKDLGVTEEQFKVAYKKLALYWHPDKNSDPQAKEKFQRLQEAYTKLTDQ